jgi:hypothetical protein
MTNDFEHELKEQKIFPYLSHPSNIKGIMVKGMLK